MSDPFTLDSVHVVCFSSGDSFHLSVNCHSLSPAALYKHSHLLTFTSSFNNKTSRNNIFIEEGQEKQKNRREKQVLWDQWCKKLFLLNSAWLTFPADTDKRMEVSRPLYVLVNMCAWLSG